MKFVINFGGLAVALLAVYIIYLILQENMKSRNKTTENNEEMSGKINRMEKKIDYILNGIDTNTIDHQELKRMIKALEQDIKSLENTKNKTRDDYDE